jgi:AcrR family transcriptional regulator
MALGYPELVTVDTPLLRSTIQLPRMSVHSLTVESCIMSEGAETIDPPRTVRRATAMPAGERRSMIVRATLPLLLEHGEMVTSRQIAEAAGIAEGTIFRVFADKDALIAAVIDTAFDVEELERSLGAIDADRPLEDCLVAAIDILQRRVIDIWRLVSSVGTRFHERTHRSMADSDALLALFDVHRSRLRVAPAIAARLLRALTLSTTHPMLAGEPMSPEEIATLFLHGCGRPLSC